MNNIIAEKNKKRYLPHDVNTRKYAVEMYRNCGDIEYVCRKYHISRVSLWRWNKKYNGTKESLNLIDQIANTQIHIQIKKYAG